MKKTTSMKKIIGIAGQKRNGKSTLAEMIGDRFCFPVMEIADALKVEVYDMIFSDPRYLNPQYISREEKISWVDCWKEMPTAPNECEKPVRQMLQELGQLKRTFKPTHWLKRAYADVPGPVTVFSDVRYDNECEYIRSRGGIIIAVIRPDYVNSDPHPSESEIRRHFTHHPAITFAIESSAPWDAVYVNKGTLDDMEQWVAENLPALTSKMFGR